MIDLFVEKEARADYYDSSWAIRLSRDLDELVGSLIHRLTELSDYMVQAQVHLIDGEDLLAHPCYHRRKLVVGFPIVHLQASKLRIFDPHVNSHHIICDCVGLVGV